MTSSANATGEALSTDDGLSDVPLSTPVAMLRRQLEGGGRRDLRRVAEMVHAQRQRQVDANLFYSYEAASTRGSDHTTTIQYRGTTRDAVLWSVNHYLGLNRDPRIIEAGQKALAEFGTGCGGSAMSGGVTVLHRQLEERLARFLGKEEVLLFPTGFTANTGGLGSLAGKRDVIFSDAENHASLIEGCRLSRAKVVTFAHNNVADLEQKLASMRGEFDNAFVAVEAAYSMSGDLAPLREIAALKRRHDFMLFVDEAHSFGIYGVGGRGWAHEQGVADEVDFLMSTLSKSAASIGGFVAMRAPFRTYLTWAAKAYLFQACLPPSDVAVIMSALDVIEHDPEPARRLHENNAHLRTLLREAGFEMRQSRSPIVPVYIPDPQKLVDVTAELFEQGVFSVAIVYPAVEPDQGRLRFIVNATHTREEIERTVEILRAVCRRHDVIPA
jgi:8-amino-7-oxononanoate synthase